jgi:hypothetical protein
LDARAPEPDLLHDAGVVEVPADDTAMIAAMRSYREAKTEHDQRKEPATAYLEQVRQQIEADLAAGEEHLERLRSSMLAFLTEHNGGSKFNVPGLGTATTTTRTSLKIADQEAFLAAIPHEERDKLFDRKLNNSRAKAAAKAALEETGEELPGVEADRVTSLSVRLSGG